MTQPGVIKGAVFLTVAILFTKILGSFFRIPLQNIAGDEVLGIFTLVYPVYMVSLTLSVAGIPLSMSKLIAETRSTDGSLTNIFYIHKTSKLLSMMFGIGAFTIIGILSVPISEALGSRATLPALLIVSLSLVVAPYMAVYRGYFQGFGDMKPTAISQVLEQGTRVTIILITAYIAVGVGLKTSTTAGIIMTGSFVGVLASFLYLILRYQRSNYRVSKKSSYTLHDFITWSSHILKVSLPIAFGTLTLPLFQLIDALTIPGGLLEATPGYDTNYLFGIYGRGMSLIQISTVFATSIIYPLLPAISSRIQKNDLYGVQSEIRTSEKWNHLISWPIAMIISILALPLNIALFTNEAGTVIISILGLSSVFISFTIITTGILQGLNKGKIVAFFIVIAAVLKISSNLLLVPAFGLYAAAWINVFTFFVIYILNTFLISRTISVQFFPPYFLRILISILPAGIAIGLPLLLFSFEDWSRFSVFLYVVLSVTVGILLYLGSLLLSKAILWSELRSVLKR